MNKPTLVIVNNNYPNENNRYGDVFVHSRLKHYRQYLSVHVVGWNKRVRDYSFEYEGIHVEMVNTSAKLKAKINSYNPDVLGFHFVEGWMHREIIAPFKGPSFVWIHGGEALGWYRRLFQLTFKTLYPFARYVMRNTIQMFQIHQLISYANKTKKVKFIFVSKWMRSITEADTMSQIKDPAYVPNPIDPTLFKYIKKTPEQRKKILLIRSFDSKKYANDIAVSAIIELSSRAFFGDLQFTIYGVGRYFTSLTSKLKHFPNVTIHNDFLENKDIPSIHKSFGIFLCPTRQDAQGVSMCESMSSGLVPISSYSTAIPEFLEHGVSGFMTHDAKEIADTIEKLYHDPDLFLSVSENAAQHIRAISSTDLVVKTELDMILESLNRSTL